MQARFRVAAKRDENGLGFVWSINRRKAEDKAGSMSSKRFGPHSSATLFNL